MVPLVGPLDSNCKIMLASYENCLRSIYQHIGNIDLNLHHRLGQPRDPSLVHLSSFLNDAARHVIDVAYRFGV